MPKAKPVKDVKVEEEVVEEVPEVEVKVQPEIEPPTEVVEPEPPEVVEKPKPPVCPACESKNIIPDIGDGTDKREGHSRCHECDKHWGGDPKE